jgi:shikimate dehydrogenase
MHKAAYDALGLDAIYSTFEARPAQLKFILKGLDICRIDGLNVTVPHKEKVFKLLGRENIQGAALEIGAVNTLVRSKGRLIGHNTDAEGAKQVFTKEMKQDFEGANVLLLGAGGAARAISWAALSLKPRSITISNIVPSMALALRRMLKRNAGKTKIDVVPFDKKHFAKSVSSTQLLINATSLGMHVGDPSPFPLGLISKRLAVFDVVYCPGSTKLIRQARKVGALAADGVPMLVYQGAAAFELWWNRTAPVDVMRRSVERAIAEK